MGSPQKRSPFKLLLSSFLFILALSTLFFCISRSFTFCRSQSSSSVDLYSLRHTLASPTVRVETVEPPNPLQFVNGKEFVLVSHELSLSGGPLLLMELALLLKQAGAQVNWITNQKDTKNNPMSHSLELKLTKNGIQVLPARGPATVQSVRHADLLILNTAVAGKWIDSTFKDDTSEVLQKTLWWIHEMRGHYFNLDFVKHLPNVAAAMIDSFATAEYWKNRTQERLGINMPPTYVVHLGNSRALAEASENVLARSLLRDHVREALGLNDDDIVFSVINSVSRGKGQDLFLKSFYEAIQLMKSESSETQQNMHAVIVGCDAKPGKYELELRDYVKEKGIEHLVHFVMKTMNVIPYLAAIDILVQNSQAHGECFGRITIEAMAFQLPVLGTSAGGTREIVVDGTTGFLHPVGKEGIPILAKNMVRLHLDPSQRLVMGKKGYERVQEQFMEKHMAHQIGRVLQIVMKGGKKRQESGISS